MSEVSRLNNRMAPLEFDYKKFSTRLLFEKAETADRSIEELERREDRHADSLTDICKRLDELEHCARTGEPYGTHPAGMKPILYICTECGCQFCMSGLPELAKLKCPKCIRNHPKEKTDET